VKTTDEALRLAATKEFDLYVLDYRFPDMTGIDGLKDLAIDPDGNVVITGESEDTGAPSNMNLPNYDAATVKFDGAGNQLWARTYKGATGGVDARDDLRFRIKHHATAT
jgi:CheY-like chemotaxis protein